MLFLGNIITGLFWMRFAVRKKDLKIIRHTMNAIIKLDRYFTIPGVVIITAAGIFAAIYGHFPILGTGWILWSIIMFSVSGIVFGVRVAPLQKRIYNLTLNKEMLPDTEWNRFMKLYFQWDIWGIIAILTPMAAFVMMTLKIPS
jgi:uncharacterized membrane protein